MGLDGQVLQNIIYNNDMIYNDNTIYNNNMIYSDNIIYKSGQVYQNKTLSRSIFLESSDMCEKCNNVKFFWNTSCLSCVTVFEKHQ